MSKPIPIPKSISKGSLIDYPITDSDYYIPSSDLTNKDVLDIEKSMGYDRRFPNPPDDVKKSEIPIEKKMLGAINSTSPGKYQLYPSPEILSTSPLK